MSVISRGGRWLLMVVVAAHHELAEAPREGRKISCWKR